MRSVDGGHLRAAVRKGLLGLADAWGRGEGRAATASAVEAWRAFVEARLEAAGDGYLHADLERKNARWTAVVAVAEIALETEDFSGQSATSERKTLHSFVDVTTGFVFLVDPDTNEAALDFGARASVHEPASFTKALTDQGMMRQFQGSVRDCLNVGVDIDDANDLGETSLMLAAGAHNSEAIALLLSQGANANKQTLDGATALHFAVQAGQDEDAHQVVKMLLDSGAQDKLSNRWGFTPLHVAAFRGLALTCGLLVDRRSTCKLEKDTKGRVAAYYASEANCSRRMDGTSVFDERVLAKLR